MISFVVLFILKHNHCNFYITQEEYMVVTLVENVGELLLWEIISHPTCWLKTDKSRGSIRNVGIALINKVRLRILDGGHMGCKNVHPWNYFSIFSTFELKLCGMVELCIP